MRFPLSALPLLSACLVLGACGSHETPSAPHSASPSRPARSSVDSPWVDVHAPEDLSLLEAPGRALAGTSSVEAISAGFPLRVTRVHVQAGDEVRAGDAIVDVTSQEVLRAAADYVSSTESLAAHDERLETLRHLREARVVAIDRVFEVEAKRPALREQQRAALATLRSADVSAQQAAAVLQRGGITLRTSTAGIVRDLSVIPGQVFPQGGTFATIVGGSSPRVEARFVSLLPDGFAYEFEDLQGRHVSLGDRPTRVLDAGEEGGIRVWFDLPEGVTLPPGAPGHVRAHPTDARFLEIPVEALVRASEGADRARVLRRRQGREEAVEVRVVTASGTNALVEGELAAGDQVASDGTQALAARPAPGGGG